MSEITLGYYRDSPSREGGYWYAAALVDGSVHTDASASTIEAALATLAKELADHIEETA